MDQPPYAKHVPVESLSVFDCSLVEGQKKIQSCSMAPVPCMKQLSEVTESFHVFHSCESKN